MRRFNSKIGQAQELTQSVKQAYGISSNVIGSEVRMGDFLNQVPRMPAISYTLDNSAGIAIQRYLIGDPTGMIAVLIDTIGGGVVNPDLVQGNALFVSPNKNFFFSVGLVYSSINYLTSSDEAQFSQPFKLITVNSAGEISSEGVNMASAQRNSQFNNLLLTLTGEYMLDVHRGIQVDVLAGEKVTLTFVVSTYTV